MQRDAAHVRELRRGIGRIVALLVLLGLLYAFLPLQSEGWWVGIIVGLCALTAIAPIAIRRAVKVGTSEHPAIAAAEAIIFVVSLLLFGFASMYLTIDRVAGQFAGLETRVDALYFTVTTLSTVGFGDVHASGQGARLAVTAQILFDLSVFAMSLRWLVSAVRSRAEPLREL